MPSFKSTTVALLLSFAGAARGDYSYGAPKVENPLAQAHGAAGNVSPDVGKLTGGPLPAVQPTSACPPTGGQGVQGCTFVRNGANYGYVVETSQYNGEPHNQLSNGPLGAAQAPLPANVPAPHGRWLADEEGVERAAAGESPELAMGDKEQPLLLNGCVMLPDGRMDCSVNTPGFIPPPTKGLGVTPYDEHVMGVTGPSMEPAVVAQGPQDDTLFTSHVASSAKPSVTKPVVVTLLPVPAVNEPVPVVHARPVAVPSVEEPVPVSPHASAFPYGAPGVEEREVPFVPSIPKPYAATRPRHSEEQEAEQLVDPIVHLTPAQELPATEAFPEEVGARRQHAQADAQADSTVAAGSVRGDVGSETLSLETTNYSVDCVTATTPRGEQVPLNCAGHGVFSPQGQGREVNMRGANDANRLGMGGRPAPGFHRSSGLTQAGAEANATSQVTGRDNDANELGMGGRPASGFHRSSPLQRAAEEPETNSNTPALRGAANNGN